MDTITFISLLVALLAVTAGAVYVYGVPPEVKRKMEDTALETMGENKASYLVKDQVNKLPASDQKDVSQVKEGLGNALGGSLQNPVGKAGGDIGDQLTSPLTGR